MRSYGHYLQIGRASKWLADAAAFSDMLWAMKVISAAPVALLALLASSCMAQSKPVFQENFESGKLDPAVWDTRVLGTATAAVEPVEGGHGKYAFHVHYPDMAARSY